MQKQIAISVKFFINVLVSEMLRNMYTRHMLSLCLCCWTVCYARGARLRPTTHFFDNEMVVNKLGYLSSFAKYQRPFIDYDETTTDYDKDRRHSFPFVTGDGFRSLADVIVDTIDDVKNACSLLTNTSAINQRLRLHQSVVLFVANDGVTLSTLINANCIGSASRSVVIIVHNGDADGISSRHQFLAHGNVLAVFTQNCDGFHSKITCIPIGIENRRWPRHGRVPEVLAGAMSGNLHGLSPADIVLSNKANAIATSCFTPDTYQLERVPLFNMINSSAMNWIDNNCRHDAFHFYRKVLRSAAVIAPRGNGKDTHRAWESLYLGRMIVTLSSSLDPLWEGLPVLLLRDWNDLSEEVVRKRVLTMSSPQHLQQYQANTPKLFLDYWACLIGKAANRKSKYCTLGGLRRVLNGL